MLIFGSNVYGMYMPEMPKREKSSDVNSPFAIPTSPSNNGYFAESLS